MIAIETQRLVGIMGKVHIRARTFGCSAVYLKEDPKGPLKGNLFSLAALEVAKLALACDPVEIIHKRVHFDAQAGFAVWIAFDRRKG